MTSLATALPHWPKAAVAATGAARAANAGFGHPRRNRATLGSVAVLHLIALWGMAQLNLQRPQLVDKAPLWVTLLGLETPAPAPVQLALPPPTPLPKQQTLQPPLPPTPTLPTPQPQPTPAPTSPAEPAPVATAPSPETPTRPTAAPSITVAAVAPPAPPTPPPSVQPPQRVQLAASAVRYAVLPPVEVPRAARRAGEHGVVWVRVVVGVNGLPLRVTLERSSGHSLLDEQALWAMRQARFKPHTEGGVAVEVEVIAPIEYPAD